MNENNITIEMRDIKGLNRRGESHSFCAPLPDCPSKGFLSWPPDAILELKFNEADVGDVTVVVVFA